MKAFAAKSPSNDTSTKSAGVKHRHTPGPKSVPSFTGTNTFIQTKSICPCDGGCPRCSNGGVIQPKLTIGAPNDKYEQEADRVADQVMRMPDPQVQRNCTSCGDIDEEQIQTKAIGDQVIPIDYVQRQEEEPEEEEEEPVQAKLTDNNRLQRQEEEAGEEEEELVQPKSLKNKALLVNTGLHNKIQSLKGSGQPLSASTRAFFQPRFGRNFSNVRVHTGAKAAGAAKSINAKAFTTGKDVVFGTGQYAPETTAGKQLLAHELTHVVQQTAKPAGQKIQRAVTFDASCNTYPYLQCAIYEAVRDARRQVGLVLTALAPVVSGQVNSGRIVNLLNVHFHVPTAAQIAEINRRFQLLNTVLAAPATFKCLARNDPACRSLIPGGVIGGRSTVCGGGHIEICEIFNNFSCITRTHIIIHELAHHDICAPTDIYAGLHPTQYMTLTNVQAMENADTYAQFAQMVDLGTPICRNCYLPSGARPTGP